MRSTNRLRIAVLSNFSCRYCKGGWRGSVLGVAYVITCLATQKPKTKWKGVYSHGLDLKSGCFEQPARQNIQTCSAKRSRLMTAMKIKKNNTAAVFLSLGFAPTRNTFSQKAPHTQLEPFGGEKNITQVLRLEDETVLRACVRCPPHPP